jgi:hypothetical protein
MPSVKAEYHTRSGPFVELAQHPARSNSIPQFCRDKPAAQQLQYFSGSGPNQNAFLPPV